MRLRTPLLAGAALLACGAAAAPASAAVTATQTGTVLAITGDAAPDRVSLSRDATTPTQLNVDLDGNGTADQSFDKTTLTTININGGEGADVIDLVPTPPGSSFFADETVTIDGAGGDDELRGADGTQTLNGGPGNDRIDGNGGVDLQNGNGDDDVIIWDPGDGNDLAEGSNGQDTLEFNGAAGAEIFAAVENAGRVRFTRNLGNIIMDVGTIEQLKVDMKAGTDTFSSDPNLAQTTALRRMELLGGDDADTITGSDTRDAIDGGAGVDTIACRGGNDFVTPDAADVVAADCPKIVVEGPQQPGGGGTQVDPPAKTAPLPVLPAPEVQRDTSATNDGQATGRAAAAKLGRPRIKLVRGGVQVTVANAGAKAASVRIAASERAGGKRFRYAAVVRRVAAGGKVTVTLKASKALKRALSGRARGTRRPAISVTDLATGAVRRATYSV